MLRIKLIKSPIGNNIRNRRTVTALGLRKVHQVVEQPDNPSIRGMIHKVQHMVTFEVVEGEVAKAAKPAKAAAPKAAEVKAAPKPKKTAEKPAAKAPKAKAEASKPKPDKKPAKKVEEKA